MLIESPVSILRRVNMISSYREMHQKHRASAGFCCAAFFLLFVVTPNFALAQDDLAPGERPGETDNPYLKAVYHFENNQLDEAIAWGKEAEEKDPKSLAVLFLIGRTYLAQASGLERYTGFAGNFRRDLLGEGEAYFRRALEIEPANTDVRNHLAFSLLLLKNSPAARNQAEEVLKRKSDDVYASYLLGEIYLEEGQAEKAVSHFQKSIEIDKEYAVAFAGLIRAYVSDNMRKEAGDAIIELVKIRKEIPEILFLAFSIYEEVKLYSDAVLLYKSILKVAPDRDDIKFQLGTVHYYLKQNEEAKLYYDQVLKKAPDHEAALYFYGCILQKESKLDEAQSHLLRCSGIEGSYFSFALTQLHKLALIFAEKRDYKRAFHLFDKILEQTPSDTAVLSNKALTLSRAGFVKKAEDAFNLLQKLEPWESSYVNNFALFLFGQGRDDEGLKMLEKAFSIDGNLDALENLGSYYFYYSNASDQADVYFKEVLSKKPDRTKALVLHTCVKLDLIKSGE